MTTDFAEEDNMKVVCDVMYFNGMQPRKCLLLQLQEAWSDVQFDAGHFNFCAPHPLSA